MLKVKGMRGEKRRFGSRLEYGQAGTDGAWLIFAVVGEDRGPGSGREIPFLLKPGTLRT